MQPTDAFISSFVEWVEWASGVRVHAMLYFIYTPLNAALRRAASPFHLQLGAAAYVTKPCSMQLAVPVRACQRNPLPVTPHLNVSHNAAFHCLRGTDGAAGEKLWCTVDATPISTPRILRSSEEYIVLLVRGM